MKTATSAILVIVFFAAMAVFKLCAYTVGEQEQIIITQFGKPVGDPVKTAGLHFKLPFVQVVNRFEKRVLEWDGPSARMPTRDKVYVVVDTFGRWVISDPLLYYQRMRDERSALSRLDDILGSETRNVIAKNDFMEVVRTTKDRVVTRDENLAAADSRIGLLHPISRGRSQLEAEIFKSSLPKVSGYGVTLLDVRVKRVNYNDSVSQTIYERMISERSQIAERFRSEGAGEAAKILGQRERDLKTIESEAYRKIQEIEGAADAKATEIYAKAYNQNPESVKLFEFLRSMETYKKVMTPDTTLVLTTDSDFFQYLKSSEPPTPANDLTKSLLNGPSLIDLQPK
jgi:membrane protease subunit HflC